MIRYVHIGDQINEGADEFAFYDTRSDSFIDFEGSQTFDSLEDFALFAKDDQSYERCLGLMRSGRKKNEK